MGLIERLFRWGCFLALLLGFILIPFILWGDLIEQWVDSPERWNVEPGFVAVLGGVLLAADMVLPVPSSIVGVLLGSTLGIWTGTLVGLTGMTIGCVIGFALGRLGSESTLRKLVPPQDFHRVALWLDRYGTAALIMCRAVPVVAEASIIAAGAMRVPFARMLIATGFANTGVSFAYAATGALATGLSGFLLAFVLSVTLPGIVLVIVKAMRSVAIRRQT